MPLWSLTQERVEKLMRQIGDKEIEIDKLIKLSKEDLWRRDLDDFITEWRFQLEEDHQRQRKLGKTKRVSGLFEPKSKARKRKGNGSEDEDWGAPKKKTAGPTKQSTITASFEPRPPPPVEVPTPRNSQVFADILNRNNRKPSTDGASDEIDMADHDVSLPSKPKRGRKPKAAATANKSNPVESPRVDAIKADDQSDSELARRQPRQARAAAQKPIKYGLLSDSDSDNDDDLLGDVGKMVKGLPAVSGNSRSFFSSSTSRPGSGTGYRPSSKVLSKVAIDLTDDDTDYTKLIPQNSPRRSILVTAKENNIMDDDNDEFVNRLAPEEAAFQPRAAAASKPGKTSGAKASVKAEKKPLKKKATNQVKKNIQSPIAKAYAKRLAKKRAVDSDNEIEAMADDILDENDSVQGSPPPTKRQDVRPPRRATAIAKKTKYTFDDEDDEDESDDVHSGGESADFSES